MFKRWVFWGCLGIFLSGLAFFHSSCASTVLLQRVTGKVWGVAGRLYDLESRGIAVEELNSKLENCQALRDQGKTSEADSCLDALIQEVNGCYRQSFPLSYVYDGVLFEDVFMELSTSRKLGFIASPEKPGRYPGIIFLKGAGGTAFDLKRLGHSYAKEGYISFIPDFKDDFSMSALFDLKKWYDSFLMHPRLDRRMLAALSVSRGGYFVHQLITQKATFDAWICYYGVLFPEVVDKFDLKINPVPILILHGKKDDQCPVEWAYNLARMYEEAGVPYEIKIFDNEGHGFSREAGLEARRLALAFLKKCFEEKNSGANPLARR